MSGLNSIGVCFFGLSAKDIAVFERVIEFIKKKGKNFHQCPAEAASLLIVNDDIASIKHAQQQKKSQLIITVSDNDCLIGDYKIKRPLLITRVMRAFDECSKQCKASHSENNKIAEETNSTTNDTSTLEPPATQEKQYDFHALVVDDSAAIRKQLEIELRETAIKADYACCGKEALEKINNTQYDLVFLDIIMPDIDGYEVCKRLRKKAHYKKTPVIMLSGKTEPLDEVEGILAGASTYLLKPVKHNDFQKTLDRISRWLAEYAKR